MTNPFAAAVYDDLLDQAIRDHREACIILGLKARLDGVDGAQIRKDLDEADTLLKDRFMVILTARAEGAVEESKRKRSMN